MNADQLLDLIGEADDNYIRDASKGPVKKSASPTSKIRRILLPITAAAAGVFLLMNIGGRSGSGTAGCLPHASTWPGHPQW